MSYLSSAERDFYLERRTDPQAGSAKCQPEGFLVNGLKEPVVVDSLEHSNNFLSDIPMFESVFVCVHQWSELHLQTNTNLTWSHGACGDQKGIIKVDELGAEAEDRLV